MELRGENDIRAAGSSLHSSYHQSSGRNGGGGGGGSSPVIISYNAVTTTTPQTLDHHHHHHHPGRHPSSNNNNSARSPNHHPDRLAIVSSAGSNSKPPVRYRECLRNHAASVGGNVFDGCGEFMPGGEEGTLEALKCAACDCHRNFHRKEVDGGGGGILSPVGGGGGSRRSSATMIHSLQLPPAPHRYSVVGLHSSSPTAAQPMSVAFGGGGGGTESSSEDLNHPFQTHHHGDGGGMITAQPPNYLLSKKRFRTKFSGDQKDKMMEFAEKVGWRINKQDEEEVERFCAEVGVRRQVFKVWMHNNKNIKKQPNQQDDHHQVQDQEEQH